MRLATIPACVAALLIGLAGPAAAWDARHGETTLYVHHHVYLPLRVRHVVHYHALGPRHVNVVHVPAVACGACGDPFWAHRYYYWAGYRADW